MGIVDVKETVVPARIARIKEILESLVGGQTIGLHGNFWGDLNTGDDFANFRVFGDSALTLVVRGDAENSNLVKALEGRQPFDGSNFPRMPAQGPNRRFATVEEIALIRQWIDDGCPDDPPRVADALLTYAELQTILESATGDRDPFHDGVGKFWRVPLAQFRGLKVPYNAQLDLVIPGSGATSPLVLVLKGQLPGVPRMPMARPPVSPENIARIERWIDAGMPS